jgi:hypothetical protein
MVQVHVLARVWGFESLRWHQSFSFFSFARVVSQDFPGRCGIVTVKPIPLQLAVVLVMTSVFAVGQTVQSPPSGSLPAAPYQPITPRQRLNWVVDSTIGPETLTVGLLSAGFGTARDAPKEYGPHWGGFADRYGMRLTGVSTGNAMEAGLGSLWGEDPRYRYFRNASDPFKDRLRRVVVMTFVAHDRHRNLMPAYARYIATPGSNFLSNTWRADSEATNRSAVLRTVWGFAGLMGKNAFTEFWPDVRQRIFRTKR